MKNTPAATGRAQYDHLLRAALERSSRKRRTVMARIARRAHRADRAGADA